MQAGKKYLKFLKLSLSRRLIAVDCNYCRFKKREQVSLNQVERIKDARVKYGVLRCGGQLWSLAAEGVHRVPVRQHAGDMAKYVHHLPRPQFPCTRWEYDTSESSRTIVSEWDLVCDREWLISLAKSVFMFGYLLSVILFGQISDWIGRLPTTLLCYVGTCISMFLSLLSTSYIMFAVLRFFQSFFRAGITIAGYVLLMEIVAAQHQAEVGICIQFGWSFGFITLPAIAWFVRDWFWFQLVLSLSFLPFAFAYIFVPESPRWLLVKGKTDKLEKLLVKAAAINRREIKGDVRNLEMFKSGIKEEENKNQTFWEVLKIPKMRNRTFNMIYIWIVNAFLYYGLSYNTNDLAGNPYLNFFLAGLLEFPSYVLVFWSIKKWGRRPTLVYLMLIGGATYAADLPVPKDLPWMSTSLALMGKFCVTGSFGLLYLYTSEIFPTGVRNVTLGSCSMCARVGSILAPFMRDLGRATYPEVPNVLYTLLALTSGLLALALPETRGRDLPNTFQESESMGRSTDKPDKGNADNASVSLSET
ncbi:organic cation transporter protein [Nephila pilipes]|uniref:Organic cation transporter protein n=1 Tax=Nephila pilipes TaxID=299642 RepID=A0A8X6P6H6_NEPPI|nr:organic cation transporter protein [Nephila pilipes]